MGDGRQDYMMLPAGIAAPFEMAEAEFARLVPAIAMPGLDGIALALKVARDWPDLPILLMTGYSAERQRAHNLEELICRVITKPFSLEQICRTAEETLAGGGGRRAPAPGGAFRRRALP